MKFDPSRLDLLKTKLLQEVEIANVMTHFFDHFGENDQFLDVSKPARNEMLESLLLEIAGSLTGSRSKTVVQSLVMLTFAPSQFFHGAVIINGKMMNFIYFADIQTGAIGIAMTTTGLMKFVRFSAAASQASSALSN